MATAEQQSKWRANTSLQPLQFYAENDLLGRLDCACQRTGLTRSAVMRELLAYLNCRKEQTDVE